LGHDPYAHFNNVLTHPVYVTAIDASKTQIINPAANNTITSRNDPSVSLNIPANTFQSTDGKPVSITVQTLTSERLPIDPPKGVSSEQVVFVNYGDAKCNGPIPLPPPNDPPLRGPVDLYYSPVGGTSQGWTIIGSGIGGDQGIQPTSGASGIGAGTVGGGYFFWAPTAFPVRDLNQDPRNPNTVCVACRAKKSFNSEVELHSGTLTETVKLVTYQSLGSTQGLSLRYDSMRADPRPILHFGMDNVPSAPDYRLVGSLSVSRGNFTYQVPGYTGTDLRGLSGGENFWSIPPGGGSVDAAMQVDLRNQASGQYSYSLTAGVKTLCDCNYLVGSSTTTIDKLTIVNRRDSAFGSGWDIAGLQELVENDDHSILLIDGDGTQLNFNVYSRDAATGITTYSSPAGDFSVLKQLADGTFTRTLQDQSVYTFNAQKKLVNVVDAHDLETDYVYNTSGQLTQVVDAMGRTTTLSYNANGKVIAITDPANRITQMQYDMAGNLIAIINPDNSQQSYQYDADHHLVAGVDPVGDTRQNFYDFAGRATRSVHNDGSTNQINPVEVQGLLRPDATIDPRNAPLAMPLGAAESTYVDSNGAVTKTLLDNAGDEISSTDGSGNTGSTQREIMRGRCVI
jgi:YD repeat-containing protein